METHFIEVRISILLIMWCGYISTLEISTASICLAISHVSRMALPSSYLSFLFSVAVKAQDAARQGHR